METSSHTDPALIGRMRAGDERALGELFDRHGTAMYSLALSILREPREAEEVVSDAFLQLWRLRDRFDEARGSVGAYLAVTTRSRALDRLRSRRRRAQVERRAAARNPEGIATPPPNPGPAPDEAAARREQRAFLEGALGQLPESQREVMRLAYFGGHSQSEIARLLSQPLGTVKTRMRSAMRALREAHARDGLGALR